jgi:hypothetical protein
MLGHEGKKVVFVGVTCSGSTSIASTLEGEYGFKKVAHKHCNLAACDLLNKSYDYKYVIVVERDPVEKAFSVFSKLINNHKNTFHRPEFQETSGGNISKKMQNLHFRLVGERASFEDYLRIRYRWTGYWDDFLLNVKKATHVLRFSNLESDFANATTDIGFEGTHELPIYNVTELRPSAIPLESALYEKYFAQYRIWVASSDTMTNAWRPSASMFMYRCMIKCLYLRRLYTDLRHYKQWIRNPNAHP